MSYFGAGKKLDHCPLSVSSDAKVSMVESELHPPSSLKATYGLKIINERSEAQIAIKLAIGIVDNI